MAETMKNTVVSNEDVSARKSKTKKKQMSFQVYQNTIFGEIMSRKQSTTRTKKTVC